MPPVLAGGGGSDYDDEAQPAFAVAEGGSAMFDGGDVFGGDEGGPSLAELEAQMGGEVAARDASAGAARKPRAASAAEADDEDERRGGKGAPLPELDELIARVPADVRDTLDELFRARFVSVKKLPARAFQAATVKKRGADS